MSHSDKELDIPNLGPADPKSAAQVPVASAVATPSITPATAQVVAGSAGTSWVTMLVLILLVIACVGLGYSYLELQKKFAAQTQALQGFSNELTQIKESLQLAESSAAESGQSLDSQVGQLNKDVKARAQKVDSELAKLWTVAYQRNKPQLETQQKEIEQQQLLIDQQSVLLEEIQKSLASIDKAATDLGDEISRIDAKFNGLTDWSAKIAAVDAKLPAISTKLASLTKQQQRLAANGDKQSQQLTKFNKALNTTKSESGTQFAIFAEQLAQSGDQVKQLQTKLASNSNSNRQSDQLALRISSNEEALLAFDGTRRQLNSELLKLRKKLNNLQLKVEKRR